MQATTHTDILGPKEPLDLPNVLTTGVRIWRTASGLHITQQTSDANSCVTKRGTEPIIAVIHLGQGGEEQRAYTSTLNSAVQRIQLSQWELVDDAFITTRGTQISTLDYGPHGAPLVPLSQDVIPKPSPILWGKDEPLDNDCEEY